jgi:hypothetical protein
MASPFGDDDLRSASMGDLFGRLTQDMSALVRQEFELLRVEMGEKLLQSGRRLGEGAGMFSAAALTGLMAVASLTAFVILALALVMPAWLSALIVTVAYTIAAAVCAIRGKKTIDHVVMPVPTQTVETVKEDIEWAKTQATSAKK